MTDVPNLDNIIIILAKLVGIRQKCRSFTS